MRIPYSLQGLLFAPAFIALMFVLKVSCPAPTGSGCFADAFVPTLFMPLAFVYEAWGQLPVVVTHEPVFILIYWCAVGLLVGFILDLWVKNDINA